MDNPLLSTRGDLGGQLGVGLRATNRFTVELLETVAAIKASSTACGEKLDLGRGYVAGGAV